MKFTWHNLRKMEINIFYVVGMMLFYWVGFMAGIGNYISAVNILSTSPSPLTSTQGILNVAEELKGQQLARLSNFENKYIKGFSDNFRSKFDSSQVIASVIGLDVAVPQCRRDLVGESLKLYDQFGIKYSDQDIKKIETDVKSMGSAASSVACILSQMNDANTVRSEEFSKLNKDEIVFLQDSQLKISEAIKNYKIPTSTIKSPPQSFKLEELVDQALLSRYQATLSKINTSRINQANAELIKIVEIETQQLKLNAPSLPLSSSVSECTEGRVYFELIDAAGSSACFIVIADTNSNIYRKYLLLSIDFGGDDQYYNNQGGPGINTFSTGLIDFSGNDKYSCEVHCQGAGNLGSAGFLFDLAGDDSYSCRYLCQANGELVGLGIIEDHAGKDSYQCSSSKCQAQGSDGMGILLDQSGDDLYSCSSLCQAGNLGGGISGGSATGLLIDYSGNDSYHCGVDCQGVGASAIPAYGYGMIIDYNGNDQYSCEFWLCQAFDSTYQGSGGPSAIIDYSGHDSYQCSVYCQANGGGVVADLSGNDIYKCLHKDGSNTFTLSGCQAYQGGIIFDKEGDDIYQCLQKWCQGSYSLLADFAGNDEYECVYWCQGFAGLLLDNSGHDQYRCEYSCQGSLGVLYDISGNDVYACNHHCQGSNEPVSDSINTLGADQDVLVQNGGLLIDSNGDDEYRCSNQCQAYAFGALVDLAGANIFNCNQDCQGALFITSANSVVSVPNKLINRSGFVLINNDAVYTNSRAVQLNAYCEGDSSGEFKVRYANEDKTWSDWGASAPDKLWNLSNGNGDKTVYYQCQNPAGTSEFSDSIILDNSHGVITIQKPLIYHSYLQNIDQGVDPTLIHCPPLSIDCKPTSSVNTKGQSLNLMAYIYDPAGIKKVEFYINDVAGFAFSSNKPDGIYKINWSPSPFGGTVGPDFTSSKDYKFKIKAYNNNNQIFESSPLIIIINNQP